MKKKAKILFIRFGVFALTFIAAITLAELVLSFLSPVPFSIEFNMYFEPDPYTGYRLKPFGKGYFQHGIAADANRHGHRDENIDIEKEPGVFRILFLGDSFTVGANLLQEEAFPEKLETLLNQHVSSPVEVINAGVGGWAPFQYAEYYIRYGQVFSPDMVLVGFFVGNDAYSTIDDCDAVPTTAVLGRRISKRAASSSTAMWRIFLYEKSNIARLIMNLRQPVVSNVLRNDCEDFTDILLSVQRERLHKNHIEKSSELEQIAEMNVSQIQRIKTLAEEMSTLVKVIIIPDENQINAALRERILGDKEAGQLDFDMPQSMLNGLFSKAGIPYLDLLPHLRADPRCLYMNDTHLNADGAELVALLIFEDIVEDVQGLQERG